VPATRTEPLSFQTADASYWYPARALKGTVQRLPDSRRKPIQGKPMAPWIPFGAFHSPSTLHHPPCTETAEAAGSAAQANGQIPLAIAANAAQSSARNLRRFTGIPPGDF
jgi:hypothetical protein